MTSEESLTREAVARLKAAGVDVADFATCRLVYDLLKEISSLRRKIAAQDEPFEYRHRSAEADCNVD